MLTIREILRKEKQKEYNKLYYQKNKAKLSKYAKVYQQLNKRKLQEYGKAYYRKKINAPIFVMNRPPPNFILFFDR